MKTKVLRGLLAIFVGYLLLAAAYFIYLEAGGDPSPFGGTFGGKYEARLSMPSRDYADVAFASSVRNYASELPALTGGTILAQQQAMGPISDHKYGRGFVAFSR